MHPQSYFQAAQERMSAAGYEVGTVGLAGGSVVVGYRSAFKLQWMATKLHLLVVVGHAPVVTAGALAEFNRQALGYAKDTRGQLRGFQSGVAVIGALVGDHVAPDAIDYAHQRLVREFAAFAWPVAVDIGSGSRYSQQGNPKIGFVYNGWMRSQIVLTLPGR